MTNSEHKAPPAWMGWARIGVGLAQGVALYALGEIDTVPMTPWLAAAWVTAALVPVLVLGGIGALRWLTLAIWTAIAIAISAGLSWYMVARQPEELVSGAELPLSFFIVSVLLFVGHHMIAAGDEARRWIAPYERYFDLGWRHGAQLVLAVLFTGAFWAVLMLGAALFNLIGITFLADLVRKEWFVYPATTTVFAAAVHLTDMRAGLVHGARALGLVLLSWLLPAMAGLAAAFFIALPFTGLEPLWATRAATVILLSAAAALVLLINAAYQDGLSAPNIILRWSARIASVLMTPLAALAAYALYLRIEQYGLTPERIYAIAVLVVGACYAVAYAIGAFWPRWMKPLEVGNLASAVVVMVVALALFTPIADPARLSVDDQMRRWRAGVTAPDQLDLVFLRFSGARYGAAALEQLRADQSTEQARELSARIDEVLSVENRWMLQGRVTSEVVITMHPEGVALPPDLVGSLSNGLEYLCNRDDPCDAAFVELNGDRESELLIGSSDALWVYGREGDAWRQIGVTPSARGAREALRTGAVRVVPAQIGDLMLGERRLIIQREFGLDWPPRTEADDAGAPPR